jgi:hypothetical protein
MKDYHVLLQIWSNCKVIGETRYEFQSKEKAEEFLRLAHILQEMVRGKNN